MKKIHFVTLIILMIVSTGYYINITDSDSKIILPNDDSIAPIIFVPNKEIGVVAATLFEQNKEKLYDISSYHFEKITENPSNVVNEKNFTVSLVKNGSEDPAVTGVASISIKKNINVSISNSQLRFDTTDINNKVFNLFNNDISKKSIFGFVNNDKFLIEKIFKIYFTKSGILFTTSTNKGRIIDLTKHFDSTKEYQFNGIIVAVSYKYLNEYFSINSAYLGDDNEIRNIRFSNGITPGTISIDFDVAAVQFVINTGCIIDSKTNEILTLKPLSCSNTEPANQPAIAIIKEKIQSKFKSEALGRNIPLNLLNTNLYYSQENFIKQIKIGNNGDPLYYKDNVLIKIFN